MAKAESKEVAVKDDPKLPATFDYGEDAGAGGRLDPRRL